MFELFDEYSKENEERKLKQRADCWAFSTDFGHFLATQSMTIILVGHAKRFIKNEIQITMRH